MSVTDLSIRFSRQEYYEITNGLALEFKDATDLIQRNNIIANIYKLSLPLFKSWNVFDREDMEDFEQTSYFYILRSLELWVPDRGSYLGYIKFYTLKAWTSEITKHDKDLSRTDAETQCGEQKKHNVDEFPDYGFWSKIRNKLSPDDWYLFSLIFFENTGMDEISILTKTPKALLTNLKKRIFDKVKTIIYKSRTPITPTQSDFVKDYWYPVSEFCVKMRMTKNYVRELVKTTPNTSWVIDKRDYIKTPVVRIHYRCEDGKLIFPRFRKRVIRKKLGGANPRKIVVSEREKLAIEKRLTVSVKLSEKQARDKIKD